MDYFVGFRDWLLELPWLEFIKALFDLIKGIAWPLAIAFIAWFYRDDIKSLLPRVEEAGPTGVKLRPPEREQKTLATDLREAGQVELKELPGLGRTPTIARIEKDLHLSIQAYPEDQRTDIALRVLAEARLMLLFERMYRVMFGSQIAGLKRLNERTTVPLVEAIGYFEQVKEAYPDFYKDFGFADWIRFLQRENLVVVTEETVEITDLARDFLLYLTVQGLPEDKLF